MTRFSISVNFLRAIGEGNLLADGTKNQNRSGPLMKDSGNLVQAGLNKALMNVKNEQARESIQQNMNQFLEKYQNRFDRSGTGL